jgi:hypothetical protein
MATGKGAPMTALRRIPPIGRERLNPDTLARFIADHIKLNNLFGMETDIAKALRAAEKEFHFKICSKRSASL